MDHTYWHKQDKTGPLFPDMLWSRPENRKQAGKLLIISGSAAGFAVAGQAYQAALSAGAGVMRVVLPDFLRSVVPKEIHFEIDFAPGVRHGGFAKQAIGELLEHAGWADTVLIPGGIGRNSETTVLLEQFVNKYDGLLVMAEDALDVFMASPKLVFDRPNTVVVADFTQLQKIWHKLTRGSPAIKFSMPLASLVEALHLLTLQNKSVVITLHQEIIFVSHNGSVSTTQYLDQNWRTETAAKAAVWFMQHPNKAFEAITTALADQQE